MMIMTMMILNQYASEPAQKKKRKKKKKEKKKKEEKKKKRRRRRRRRRRSRRRRRRKEDEEEKEEEKADVVEQKNYNLLFLLLLLPSFLLASAVHIPVSLRVTSAAGSTARRKEVLAAYTPACPVRSSRTVANPPSLATANVRAASPLASEKHCSGGGQGAAASVTGVATGCTSQSSARAGSPAMAPTSTTPHTAAFTTGAMLPGVFVLFFFSLLLFLFLFVVASWRPAGCRRAARMDLDGGGESG